LVGGAGGGEGPTSPGFCWGKKENPGGRVYLLPWFFGGVVSKDQE
jgi:hypothetical protein